MRCAWQSFTKLLPTWMRDYVDKEGKNSLQELRLRLNAPPQLKRSEGVVSMHRTVTKDDLHYCINAVTKYSPWSLSTAAKCYYTASGGHRIGMCGNIIISDGQAVGIKELTSLCIRVARDFPGIAKPLSDLRGSVLIIGTPGSGKTTMIRDFIRQLSANRQICVSVVDERQEIFPFINGSFCFDTGLNTDVIFGCSKSDGIEAVLRNMSPSVIAVDEITAADDCTALRHAVGCGVDLIATAHAESKEDLYRRPIYKSLIEAHLFKTLLIMHPDKSWHVERIEE